MRKFLLFLFILVMVLSFAVKGPQPDKIYFGARMSQDIAVKDISEGIFDLFMNSVPGSMFKGLDKATRDKLDVYSVPSGSWDLILNPIPNAAPYQVEVQGKTYFNPFAIREIRFAMNFLIDRKYIVEEIQGGSGGPSFTPATPGQPNAWKVDLVVQKMGITPEGDKEKALADIEAAMQKASQIPENKGKLVKKDGFWYFNNEPVTIKFIIRVDDPEGRLKLGNYVSDLVEEAGIKVERLLWDRSKASNTVYNTDPADYIWQMYTEGWGAGSTYVWWRTPVNQHLAPRGTNMPGWGLDTWWNYEQPEIDKLASDFMNGNFLTEEEYWEKITKATELGIHDSIRLFITYQNDFYVANKDRFIERMPYGLGDGLNRWSLENAKVKDNILKIVQFSAAGNLFMNAWDPIGYNGFGDTYSSNVSTVMFERSMIDTPFGVTVERVATLEDFKSAPYKDAEGNIKGNINVPADAEIYDINQKKYVPVGNGVKSVFEATWDLSYFKWHHGRMMDVRDYIYANSFIFDWSTKANDQDKKYHPHMEMQFKDSIDSVYVAWEILDDNTIRTYGNYNFPMNKLDMAGGYAPSLRISSRNPGVGVAWEIAEALALLVIENDSQSGTKWGFNQEEGVEEVDVKTPKCVKDIRAKLNQMIDRKYIPEELNGLITADEAIKDYKMAIDFIDKYNHAFIGYGPFMLTKIDTDSNYVELSAYRDASYPFEKGHWEKIYKKDRARIDSLTAPDIAMSGEDAEFEINVSKVSFPNDETALANEAEVKIILVTPEGEVEFDAMNYGPGEFMGLIPSTATEKLDSGSYIYVVTATLDGLFVDTKTGSLVIY
ncbi:MAG: peptide/nickel transport system substrate-binding protein [Oceanotoga sp.]|uniref:ABC transporter substrate-binding protein n=1 Tax=Oceanotoga sp. TaxID=2108366 RepID=UPI00265667DD|nr:ABC transporter substrate-binding protein [Oceanotoga sp.]MDN5341357.1 peptide/nickel transport system substrate-binding protein [Oceanotoga sp.]